MRNLPSVSNERLMKLGWLLKHSPLLGAAAGVTAASKGKDKKDNPPGTRLFGGGLAGALGGGLGGYGGALAAVRLGEKRLGRNALAALVMGSLAGGSVGGGLLGGNLVRALSKKRPYTAAEKKRNLAVLNKINKAEGKWGKKLLRRSLKRSTLDYEQDFLKKMKDK